MQRDTCLIMVVGPYVFHIPAVSCVSYIPLLCWGRCSMFIHYCTYIPTNTPLPSPSMRYFQTFTFLLHRPEDSIRWSSHQLYPTLWTKSILMVCSIALRDNRTDWNKADRHRMTSYRWVAGDRRVRKLPGSDVAKMQRFGSNRVVICGCSQEESPRFWILDRLLLFFSSSHRILCFEKPSHLVHLAIVTICVNSI